MSVFFPKKNYGHNKQKRIDTIEHASRIPFGSNTIQPYYIYPNFIAIEKQIDEQLEILLKTEPPCLDSQNGNVLDSLINIWYESALEGLKYQKVKHDSAIQTLIAIRQANLENAKSLINIDTNKLAEIEMKIFEDEKIFKENEF